MLGPYPTPCLTALRYTVPVQVIGFIQFVFLMPQDVLITIFLLFEGLLLHGSFAAPGAV
jgi:hypothetical protein